MDKVLTLLISSNIIPAPSIVGRISDLFIHLKYPTRSYWGTNNELSFSWYFKIIQKIFCWRSKSFVVSKLSKMVKKVIKNLDSSNVSGLHFISVVVLKNSETAWTFIHTSWTLQCVWTSLVFQITGRCHWWSLHLRTLGKVYS